jgi:hypothetical protein
MRPEELHRPLKTDVDLSSANAVCRTRYSRPNRLRFVEPEPVWKN